MRATKRWRCDCGCGGHIEPGQEFTIQGGEFFLLSHTTGDCFESAGVEAPKRGFVQKVREVEQKPVSDLPLFDPCPVIQTRLF